MKMMALVFFCTGALGTVLRIAKLAGDDFPTPGESRKEFAWSTIINIGWTVWAAWVLWR